MDGRNATSRGWRRRIGWLGTALLTVASLATPSVATASGDDHVELLFWGIHSVPGEDYTLSGAGVIPRNLYGVLDQPIDLNGVSFVTFATSDEDCHFLQALPDGQEYTLVSTTGGLTPARSGTLSDGSVVTVPVAGYTRCRAARVSLRIDYRQEGDVERVVATVVDSGPPIVTATRVRGHGGETNEPVTLTASVDVSSGSATGRVDFTGVRFGSTASEPLCPSPRVVATAGSPAIASCPTSFAASDMQMLRFGPAAWFTVTFVPDDPAATGSSLDRDGVNVVPGLTTTSLPWEDGRHVVATVESAFTGPARPGGAVRFSEQGVPVRGCSRQLLAADTEVPTAICDLGSLAPGPHTLEATYLGDERFAGSTSSQRQLVVGPPAIRTPVIVAPPASGGATPPPPGAPLALQPSLVGHGLTARRPQHVGTSRRTRRAHRHVHRPARCHARARTAARARRCGRRAAR